MLSELKDSPAFIGLKQSRRALDEGRVAKAFVARDADERVVRTFIADCSAMNVEVEQVESMVKLGHAAGIEIGAAVAVVLKN